MNLSFARASAATAAFVMTIASMPVGVADAPAPEGLYDFLHEAALRDSGGDLSAPIGEITMYGPEGAVTQAINGHQWLEMAEIATSHLELGQSVDAAPPSVVGAGIPYPFSLITLWPFCDTNSIFVYHYGAARASIASATSAPIGVPGPVVCGGGFGPANAWQVKFDTTGLTTITKCGAAMVMSSTTAQVGFLGGYSCNNWVTGCATGIGTLFAASFGFATLDFYLGAAGSFQLNSGAGLSACA